MKNWLTPHWEHPATVWCAHCTQPLEITMSSSVTPAETIHGSCWTEYNTLKEKP